MLYVSLLGEQVISDGAALTLRLPPDHQLLTEVLTCLRALLAAF